MKDIKKEESKDTVESQSLNKKRHHDDDEKTTHEENMDTKQLLGKLYAVD